MVKMEVKVDFANLELSPSAKSLLKKIYCLWSYSIGRYSLKCVVIIARENPRAKVETGIDVFVEAVGMVDDDAFFENNTCKGKKYLCGPTCEVHGVTVHCLMRWSPIGSMTSEILRDICATLDHLEDFNRSTGAMPFFLLDRHGSRIELPFVEYINDLTHLWCLC